MPNFLERFQGTGLTPTPKSVEITNKDPLIDKLHTKFIDGIWQKHEVSEQDLHDGKWTYAGGTKGSHARYFLLLYGTAPPLQQEESCVCDHHIERNCFIKNKDDDLITIGICCIEKFMPKECGKRTCKECGKNHINRAINKCNECKTKCPHCNNSIGNTRIADGPCKQCRSELKELKKKEDCSRGQIQDTLNLDTANLQTMIRKYQRESDKEVQRYILFDGYDNYAEVMEYRRTSKF